MNKPKDSRMKLHQVQPDWSDKIILMDSRQLAAVDGAVLNPSQISKRFTAIALRMDLRKKPEDMPKIRWQNIFSHNPYPPRKSQPLPKYNVQSPNGAFIEELTARGISKRSECPHSLTKVNQILADIEKLTYTENKKTKIRSHRLYGTGNPYATLPPPTNDTKLVNSLWRVPHGTR